MDQTLFATLRATGRDAVVQCVWVYDRAVDLDGLRRFHRNLSHGLLGRRIERSPLPFGRHRWVTDPGPPEIDIAESARPRGEVGDWADERTQLRIDPERGPGWHLGVLPLTDGASAVSLVASHCLIDGLGLAGAIADAARGVRLGLDYPPPGSVTRWRGLLRDAGQTVRDAPAVARAVLAAVKQGRHQDDTAGAAPPAVAVPDGDAPIVVPSITIYLDVADWDARAAALGGTTHHLAAAFAATLGERLGRRHDGVVTVQFPISDRRPGDTRANALSFVDARVDPAGLPTDLAGIRATIGRELGTLRQHPDAASPILPLTPLIPFVPKPVLARLSEAAFAYGELPVACSNLGDLDPAVACPDGTAADYVYGRGAEQHLTRGYLEHTLGQLSLLSMRLGGRLSITVAAYQPGADNGKAALRELAARTLAEFDLTGVIA
ncbi:hypothetical protein BKN37_20955 [Mycobacterium talmoniae]|uniref:Diacylglycerol O-acyltransferase n=2 Tax=Mycobacterium talmoniae TaxID=1858794 RepID=A0A1S1ND37_9MYCO|nr:hypothetical protein BKN37_20955 [Mycobacterium talmoniae]TDH51143.1 hypothetical protein E2F47_16640 [Mycobacterium eburneum]